MTTLIAAADTILKTDTKGRVHTPADRRERLLDEFERSGLSGTKFAELTGIKYSTFAAWAARRRKRRGQSAPTIKAVDSVRWLEAVVRDAQAPTTALTAVNIRLPQGVCLELTDIHQVPLAAALVQALAKSAC